MNAGEIEAVLDFRRGERDYDRKRRKCDECGRVHTDVSLYDESPDGEEWNLCPRCVAVDDMEHHRIEGHDVDCLVVFDGKACGVLPYGWFIDYAYGTLLKDGRILHGLPTKEYKPESYKKA